MILRFITRPDLDIFTNNEAERTIRPVKVQQRSSGGCWRTLGGLADFAVVQSYLSTASKWGIPKIDALRGLFNGNPWMPPGLGPAPDKSPALNPRHSKPLTLAEYLRFSRLSDNSVRKCPDGPIDTEFPAYKGF